MTYDIDLCYRRSADNLQRIAEALRLIQPTLRGVPEDLPFRIDAQALALGCNYTFDTSYGPLDLLGFVEPLGGYEALCTGAETITLGDQTVLVVGLDDLITIKQHIQRPKDRESLNQLLAIKRIRGE